MKLSNIIITSALVLGAIACTKANEEIPATKQEITITAYTAMTKTVLQEDGKVFWEPGDKINLFYNKVGGELTSNLTAPAATSTFTGTINAFGFNDAQENYPLWGVYPYNEANTSDGSSVTVTLPAKQVAKAGSFAKDTYITIGKSETFSMAFYAVTGGIRFSVTRDDIKSVSFQGAKGDTLAGKLQVIMEDGVPAITKKTAIAKILTLTAPEGETLEPGKYYYIAAVPTQLEGGFEMTFNTANKTATLKSDKAVEIKRSTFGTINNADEGLTFVERTWGDPTVINMEANTLAMEINPLTGKPSIVINERLDGSKGALSFYADPTSTPVSITEKGVAKYQYTAFGIAADGKAYAFSQNTATKKGEVYSTSDLSTWAKADVTIDQTAMYYGGTIGCFGNEAYVMTSNNANTTGGIQKRNVNVTKFDGSSWTTGNVLANRPTTPNGLYPIIVNFGGSMYVFVTDYTVGFSIYKYDGTAWSSVTSVNATSGDYSAFAYGVNEPQGMAIAPDGQIWIALGTTKPLGAAVIKINVEEGTIAQIGDTFPLTNSISARSAKIGVSPLENGPVYLVFRDDDQRLCVSTLDDDTWEWKTPEKLTTASAGDINIRFNAAGKPYIVCTTNSHVEVFTTIE